MSQPQRQRHAVASPISQGSGGQCRVTTEPMSLGAVSVTCTNHIQTTQARGQGGVGLCRGSTTVGVHPAGTVHTGVWMVHLSVCVHGLQGCFLSSANVCVVKVEGTPHLCKTDEVGEICVDSSATATAYYGLLGITKNVFEVPAGPTAVAGGWVRHAGVWPSSGCLQP